MRLTDDAVRKAKPPTKGQVLIWDDLVSGFGVRLTPTRKTFVVQWRDSAGRKPRESLRPHFPQLTVEEARHRARARLAEVLAAKETGGDVPLRLAIRSWYEQQSTRGSWRPRYRVKVDAIISTYVEGIENPRVKLSKRAAAGIEALGKKAVGAVTRSDVLAVADHIKPGTAEQFMAVLSSFFNYAYERGWVTGNPARNRLRVTGGRRVRNRVPTDDEFLALWRAFEKEGDPAFGAFALLAFTGARRREVTQARWSEFDLDAATWTLPPERRKTGRRDPEPFTIHLHPAALEIVKRQPVLEGSPYVFWGRRDKRPFEFHHALVQRLRAGVEVKDWRLHDIRRYMRSGLARLGVPQMVAELCLGHRTAKGGLVGVYDQYQYAAEKREAWMRWGEFLQSLTR
ncbi:MAG: site-specific integrase [Steroidobacteraceae bacterium]|nr:site-specific integrase [Steroidobacteraceae bacterium]